MNYFLNGFTDELTKVAGSTNNMVFKTKNVPSYKTKPAEMVFKKNEVPSYGSKPKPVSSSNGLTNEQKRVTGRRDAFFAKVKSPGPRPSGLTSEQHRVVGRRDAFFAKKNKPTQASILKKRDALFSKITANKIRESFADMRNKRSKAVASK